jgi:hypothetical protein
VYLVLFSPYRAEPAAEHFPSALANLAACSGLLPTVPRMADCEFFPAIEVVDRGAIDQPAVRSELERVVWTPTCVKISTTVDVEPRPVKGTTPELSVEEQLVFHTQAAWDDLGDFATDLLLALDIAMPGMFGLHSGYVFQNDVLYQQLPRMRTSLEEAVMLAQHMKWPRIEWLPVQSVWTWLSREDGFTDRFSTSRLGRALCAFSFLMTERPWAGTYISDLIWSMVGLEALYGRGNLDMTNQIVEKTQLFLGPQKDFKADVKKMYHYRSRLLHGDLDFASAHSGSSDDEFMNESSRASSVASAIFVATLQ